MRKMTKVVLSTLLGCGVLQAQQAQQADAFVDSVGVNVHLHYTQTLYYKNFPLIQKELVSLGVRHVRDGFISTTLQAYYDRHNALGALGIKGLFTTTASQSPTLLRSWPANVSRSFEGFENPNELDAVSGGLLTLLSTIPRLFFAARTSVMPSAPVVGASLTKDASYLTLGNMSSYVDFGNIHNYYAGRNPGTAGWGGTDWQGNRYGSLAYALANARITSGNKPIYSTETGYNNDTLTTNYVSQAVAAIYMPRLLLEHWNAGIKRTYIYELLSEGARPNSDFGLLTSAGVEKPAFKAVSNLLNLLSDKGSSFTPGTLNYTLNGGDSTLHKLLLQKRDGTFYLALWVERQGYNPDSHVNIAVPTQNVVLSTGQTFTNVTVHQWGSDGEVDDTQLTAGSSFALQVTDKLMIVQLSKTTSLNTQNPTWRLNLNSTPGGSVTVSPSSSTGAYAVGTTVELRARTNSGCTFTGYSGAYPSSSWILSMTPKSSVTQQANFVCN